MIVDPMFPGRDDLKPHQQGAHGVFKERGYQPPENCIHYRIRFVREEDLPLDEDLIMGDMMDEIIVGLGIEDVETYLTELGGLKKDFWRRYPSVVVEEDPQRDVQ